MKFRRSIHIVKIKDGKPDAFFYSETGCYGRGYNSRHYWLLLFGLFGVRYTIEWGGCLMMNSGRWSAKRSKN